MDYAKTYDQIKLSNTRSDQINKGLFLLNKLDVNVLKPFLMSILYDFNKEKIDEYEIIESLKIVENFLVRRMITEQSSNALNKVFATLYRDVKRRFEDDLTNSNFYEIVSYELLNGSDSAMFPTNQMLEQSFRERGFYNINSNFRNFLFERLENGDSKEAINIYGGIKNGDFSIEHIMPQKLINEWKEDLGEDFQLIHDEYLNSIGNLTLTAYNPKYSNKSFHEKQNMKDGFRDSNFKFLNEIPAKAEKWGREEILARTESIINRALELWPKPETNYIPKVAKDELIQFTGDQGQFTSYSLKGYAFIDDVYHEEIIWKELYVDVIKKLYEIDPNPILEAVEMSIDEGALGYSFRRTPDIPKKYRKIVDNVYLRTSVSNWDKFNTFRHLFPKYDLEYDALMLDAKKKK